MLHIIPQVKLSLVQVEESVPFMATTTHRKLIFKYIFYYIWVYIVKLNMLWTCHWDKMKI